MTGAGDAPAVDAELASQSGQTGRLRWLHAPWLLICIVCVLPDKKRWQGFVHYWSMNKEIHGRPDCWSS